MADDYAEFARLAAADLEAEALNDQQHQFQPQGQGVAGGATIAWKLITLVENERHAPEILPYPDAIVSEALQGLAHQTEVIASLIQARKERDADSSASASASFLPFGPEDLLRVEVQRLQYLVTDLLRIRLKKIHRYASLIASDTSAYATTLTPNETAVALRIHTLVQQAVLDGGLRLVAPELQSILPSPHAEGPECLPTPDLRRFVFATALQPMQLQLPDVLQPQDMKPGDVWICRYEDLRPYLLAGQLRLL